MKTVPHIARYLLGLISLVFGLTRRTWRRPGQAVSSVDVALPRYLRVK
jgi:hypothetical protein